jgi:hypothetical protein
MLTIADWHVRVLSDGMHNRSTAIHAGAEVSCSSELYFPSNPLEKTVNVLRFQTFTLCSHASPACLLPAQTTRR